MANAAPKPADSNPEWTSFDQAMRALINVPKAEVEKLEREHLQKRAGQKKKNPKK